MSTKNKTNNTIINVTVNGMTAPEAIEIVKSRLESVEKSAFNIAMLCAYTLGDTIPAYTDDKGIEHGEAICEKPIKKQADLLKLIGRSKATLSRWIKAMRLIIENGYFSEFATGLYPFSYDKIIAILENKKKFEGYVIADLMTMTVDTLEAMTVTEKSEEEAPAEETDNDNKSTLNDSKEEAPAEEEETAILTYNGKEYKVNKTVFEKWLAENATLA